MQLSVAYSDSWVLSTITVPAQAYSDGGNTGTGITFGLGTYSYVWGTLQSGPGSIWSGDPRFAWLPGIETAASQAYNDDGSKGTGASLVIGCSFSSSYTTVDWASLGRDCTITDTGTSTFGRVPTVSVEAGNTVVATPASALGTAPIAIIQAGCFVSTNGPIGGAGAVPPVMFHLGETWPAGALVGIGEVPAPALSYGWVFSVDPTAGAGAVPDVTVHTGCTVFAAPLAAASGVWDVTFTYGYVLFAGPTASPGVLPPEVIGVGWTVPITGLAAATGAVPAVQVLVIVLAGPVAGTCNTFPSQLILTRRPATLNLLANAAPTGQGLLDLYTLITRARWKVLVTGSVWINAGAVGAKGTVAALLSLKASPLAAQGTVPVASIRVWLPAGLLASQGTLPGVTIHV